MPPETQSRKRGADLLNLENRVSRPHSADSAVLNPLSRVAAALSLESVALSADESALAWDSINLDLRGDRPPTGSSQQPAMDPPESLNRQSSTASL